MAFGQAVAPGTPPQQVGPMAAAMQKPKLNWLGVLADALSGAAGQPGLYGQQLREQSQLQRQMALQQQIYQQHRADDNTDFYAHQDYEASHREPTGYAGQLLDAGYKPGTPEFTRRMNAHLAQADDPLITTTLPGDRFYSGPRSGLASALSGASPDMPTVSSPEEADKLPPGTRFKTLDGHIGTVPGGQTASPSGGFPRPYYGPK